MGFDKENLMRKVLASMMISLDGYYAGPNGEIDWHVVDGEFNEYSTELLNSVDTLLFGRVTYQLMADYWPTPAAIKDDPIIAAQMNKKSKMVFSKTLEKVEWQNTRLIKGNATQEILKMKQQPGKDMVIFGSGDLVTTLTEAGLIDDYRIFINPVVLGRGKTLFKNLTNRLSLKLLKTKIFRSGLVLLSYGPQ
jgi:dihydrofolate reductase